MVWFKVCSRNNEETDSEKDREHTKPSSLTKPKPDTGFTGTSTKGTRTKESGGRKQTGLSGILKADTGLSSTGPSPGSGLLVTVLLGTDTVRKPGKGSSKPPSGLSVKPPASDNQVKCGAVYITDEDKTKKLTKNVLSLSADDATKKKSSSSKYTLAIGSSFGHIHSFLKDSDPVLKSYENIPAEDKCLLLIRKPKSASKQMLKAHSWANLNRPDMQQCHWDGSLKHHHKFGGTQADLSLPPDSQYLPKQSSSNQNAPRKGQSTNHKNSFKSLSSVSEHGETVQHQAILENGNGKSNGKSGYRHARQHDMQPRSLQIDDGFSIDNNSSGYPQLKLSRGGPQISRSNLDLRHSNGDDANISDNNTMGGILSGGHQVKRSSKGQGQQSRGQSRVEGQDSRVEGQNVMNSNQNYNGYSDNQNNTIGQGQGQIVPQGQIQGHGRKTVPQRQNYNNNNTKVVNGRPNNDQFRERQDLIPNAPKSANSIPSRQKDINHSVVRNSGGSSNRSQTMSYQRPNHGDPRYSSLEPQMLSSDEMYDSGFKQDLASITQSHSHFTSSPKDSRKGDDVRRVKDKNYSRSERNINGGGDLRDKDAYAVNDRGLFEPIGPVNGMVQSMDSIHFSDNTGRYVNSSGNNSSSSSSRLVVNNQQYVDRKPVQNNNSGNQSENLQYVNRKPVQNNNLGNQSENFQYVNRNPVQNGQYDNQSGYDHQGVVNHVNVSPQSSDNSSSVNSYYHGQQHRPRSSDRMQRPNSSGNVTSNSKSDVSVSQDTRQFSQRKSLTDVKEEGRNYGADDTSTKANVIKTQSLGDLSEGCAFSLVGQRKPDMLPVSLQHPGSPREMSGVQVMKHMKKYREVAQKGHNGSLPIRGKVLDDMDARNYGTYQNVPEPQVPPSNLVNTQGGRPMHYGSLQHLPMSSGGSVEDQNGQRTTPTTKSSWRHREQTPMKPRRCLPQTPGDVQEKKRHMSDLVKNRMSVSSRSSTTSPSSNNSNRPPSIDTPHGGVVVNGPGPMSLQQDSMPYPSSGMYQGGNRTDHVDWKTSSGPHSTTSLTMCNNNNNNTNSNSNNDSSMPHFSGKHPNNDSSTLNLSGKHSSGYYSNPGGQDGFTSYNYNSTGKSSSSSNNSSNLRKSGSLETSYDNGVPLIPGGRSSDSAQTTLTSQSTTDSGYITTDPELDTLSTTSYAKSLQQSAQNLFKRNSQKSDMALQQQHQCQQPPRMQSQSKTDQNSGRPNQSKSTTHSSAKKVKDSHSHTKNWLENHPGTSMNHSMAGNLSMNSVNNSARHSVNNSMNMNSTNTNISMNDRNSSMNGNLSMNAVNSSMNGPSSHGDQARNDGLHSNINQSKYDTNNNRHGGVIIEDTIQEVKSSPQLSSPPQKPQRLAQQSGGNGKRQSGLSYHKSELTMRDVEKMNSEGGHLMSKGKSLSMSHGLNVIANNSFNNSAGPSHFGQNPTFSSSQPKFTGSLKDLIGVDKQIVPIETLRLSSSTSTNTLPGNFKYQGQNRPESSLKQLGKPSLFQLLQNYNLHVVRMKIPKNFVITENVRMIDCEVVLPSPWTQTSSGGGAKDSNALLSPKGSYAKLGGPNSAFKPVTAGSAASIKSVSMVTIMDLSSELTSLLEPGQIQKGDLIVEVNERLMVGEDLSTLMNMLQMCQGEILLTIARDKARIQQHEKDVTFPTDDDFRLMQKKILELTSELQKKDRTLKQLNDLFPWKQNSAKGSNSGEENGDDGYLCSLSDDEYIV